MAMLAYVKISCIDLLTSSCGLAGEIVSGVCSRGFPQSISTGAGARTKTIH